MGEPIKLPDGRIAYGQAQAAAMWADREEVASEPVDLTQPTLPPVDSVSFQTVRGIGPAVEMALYDAGYLTWEDVLMAGVVKIVETVPAISMSKARTLFAMAQREA